MRKSSLWMASILLVLLGVMVYWDHGFKDYTRPGMILTSILIILTILIAFFGTFSSTFNAWVGSWWVIPKLCCFALLFIVCVYIETQLYDDKHAAH